MTHWRLQKGDHGHTSW